LAVGVVAQLVPFHDSANVVMLALLVVEPTASHADAEAHATPASVCEKSTHPDSHVPSPVYVLACWSTVHVAPFHCSISGWVLWFRSGDWSPTATQLLGDVQDTLCSST
jgi:hypothetical protein